MLKKLLVATSLSILILGFILFNCKLPSPPAGPEEAKVTLLLKSSDGKIDHSGSIQDSVGKEVLIGIVLYLTQYIDSSVVRVILDADTEHTFRWAFKKNMVDTVFFPITFSNAGTHKVEVTSYIKDQPNSVDEGKIIIYAPPAVNKKPELKVPGTQSTIGGQPVSFSVSASDPDAGQIVTISAPQKPENATFTADTFRWTPGATDTGSVNVVFVATDNGVPVMADTDTVVVNVKGLLINHAPQWMVKNLQRTVKPGIQFTFDLGVNCSDPDKDSLTFLLTSAPPAKDTIVGSIYSFTPAASDTGKYIIHIIAKDPMRLSDTLTLGLTVSAIVAPDSIPPVITFLSPSKDTVISADSFEIKVTCFDDSGCAVKGFRDGTAFTLKKSTSVSNLWTGIAKGIVAGSFSAIKVVATDSSAAKNKDSVSIKIKFDNDKNGPAITLITPTKDSVTTNSSSYSIVLKVTDPSGVLSVNGTAGTASLKGVRDTDSTWKINIDNLENNKTTVVVLCATDSSLKANKTIDTVYIRSEIVNGYKIKFEKNDSAATGTMADQTINSGDSAKLSGNAFVKEGSTFGGWMVTPTGTTIAYTDGAMYKMGTAGVTLYARWIKKATFTLTIIATNGSVTKTPNAAVYDSGTMVSIKAIANIGYKFVKWTGDITGTTDSTTVVINKVTNITANFSPIPYTVTFSSQGATFLTATVNNNALVTEPDAPQAGTSYTFGGWYTSETYATKWDFLTYKVIKDTTLFAKWIPVYTVTYYGNSNTGGIVPVDASRYTSNQTVVVLDNTGSLIKTGYAFSGWNRAQNGSGKTYKASDTLIVGTTNVQLYAIWISTNKPPVVVIKQPLNNAFVQYNVQTTINAEFTDPDNNFEKAEIFINNTKLGDYSTLPVNAIWKPLNGGNVLIKVVAYDKEGATGGDSLHVNVNYPPVFPSTIRNDTATIGSFFNTLVKATDQDLNDVITYSLLVKPDGMVVNSQIGNISWNVPWTTTMKVDTTLQVVVEATDLHGGKDTLVLPVKVATHKWMSLSSFTAPAGIYSASVLDSLNIFSIVPATGPFGTQIIRTIDGGLTWGTAITTFSSLTTPARLQNNKDGLVVAGETMGHGFLCAVVLPSGTIKYSKVYSYSIGFAGVSGNGETYWYIKDGTNVGSEHWLILNDTLGIYGDNNITIKVMDLAPTETAIYWIEENTGSYRLSRMELSSKNISYSPVSAKLSTIVAAPGSEAYFAVDTTSTGSSIYRWNYWNSSSSVSVVSAKITRLKMVNNTTGWAIASSGECYFTNNGFTSVTKETLPAALQVIDVQIGASDKKPYLIIGVNDKPTAIYY